jgi:hypothetical protein
MLKNSGENRSKNGHNSDSVVNQHSSEDTGMSTHEFYFQPRTANIDWKNLRKVKVKNMIKDNTTEILPMLLPNLTMSEIKTPQDIKHFDNNEYLIDFFRLIQ